MVQRTRIYKDIILELGEGDETVARFIDFLFQRCLPGTAFARQDIGNVYYLNADNIGKNFEKFKFIRNWIKGAIANGEDWIKDLDHEGIAFRLRRISNYRQLEIVMADDQLKKRNELNNIFKNCAHGKLSREDMISRGDVDVVRVFNNGACFVRNLTPYALDRESHFIHNCIGMGGYDINLTWPGYKYYSLWDARNEPHISLEVIHDVVTECKGKENKLPNNNYMPAVIDFVGSQGWKVDPDPSKTGMVARRGRIYTPIQARIFGF